MQDFWNYTLVLTWFDVDSGTKGRTIKGMMPGPSQRENRGGFASIQCTFFAIQMYSFSLCARHLLVCFARCCCFLFRCVPCGQLLLDGLEVQLPLRCYSSDRTDLRAHNLHIALRSCFYLTTLGHLSSHTYRLTALPRHYLPLIIIIILDATIYVTVPLTLPQIATRNLGISTWQIDYTIPKISASRQKVSRFLFLEVFLRLKFTRSFSICYALVWSVLVVGG